MNFKSVGGIAVGAIAFVTLLSSVFLYDGLAEHVDAGEIVVMQDPIDGELHVWSEPGLYFQGFGTVTEYPKSDQVWFTNNHESPDDLVTTPFRTRFNDGGTGNISGNIRYDLPAAPEAMIAIHTKYRSHVQLHQALIEPTVKKAVYMSGPLMSSTESYAARRSELLDYITDQVDNGVYRTQVEEITTIDPLSGEPTVAKITKIVYEADGVTPKRSEGNPLDEFGIVARNLVVDGITYEKSVEAQIARQREMTMEIQTAKAQALKAEQAAITAQEQGKADAAEAKWREEVAKATAVTQAEKEKEVAETKARQELEVQRLATEAAQLYKKQQTLIGEGDGARKRAVMIADGALEQKLAAWLEAQKVWAQAHSTRPVPATVIGGGAGDGDTMSLEQLMSIQLARDLALDVKPKR